MLMLKTLIRYLRRSSSFEPEGVATLIGLGTRKDGAVMLESCSWLEPASSRGVEPRLPRALSSCEVELYASKQRSFQKPVAGVLLHRVASIAWLPTDSNGRQHRPTTQRPPGTIGVRSIHRQGDRVALQPTARH